MEQSKTRNHRARHKTRASLLSDKGLDAANHNCASGGGRRMFLTSPLIEQAFTLTTPVNSAAGIHRTATVNAVYAGQAIYGVLSHQAVDRFCRGGIPAG